MDREALVTVEEEIRNAAIDAITYRVDTLGQPLDQAAHEVEEMLRSQGLVVDIVVGRVLTETR